MSEWRESLLGEQINLKRGYDLPSKSRSEGDIPIFSSSGISGYHSEKMVSGPGVITGRYGTIGQVFFSKGAYWPLNTTLYVQDFKGNDTKFIYYFLQQLDWEKYSDKSAVPGVNRNDVHQEKVVFPCTSTQKAIASVLSSLDDKIDLLHRQNKTLEAMAETLFRQWFVEEAEDSWEEKSLGDFVKIIDNRGKTPPYQDMPTPYPIIEVNALAGKNRLVDYSVIRKYVSEDTFNTWFRGHPKKFDSLISTVGSIGEISMFLIEKGSIAQNVIALSAIKISPLYLFEFLKHSREVIKELDIGSVQPSIKVPHLLSIRMAIPSIKKLELFDYQVKNYLEKMILNQNQIHILESLRDTLLPKLMSGEVRVDYS